MNDSQPQPAGEAYVFAFPDLLATRRLLLDPATHTLLLLSREEADMPVLFHSALVKPSAVPILLALLQAYPHACSYHALFHALYPQKADSGEQYWDQEKALALPVIRRTLRSLRPTLRRCGLRAVAQYRQGYVLALLLPSEDQHIDHTKGRDTYGSRS